jgi:hypothetical protein
MFVSFEHNVLTVLCPPAHPFVLRVTYALSAAKQPKRGSAHDDSSGIVSIYKEDGTLSLDNAKMALSLATNTEEFNAVVRATALSRPAHGHVSFCEVRAMAISVPLPPCIG